MIQGISAQYGMGLGLYTCPHCGRSGLTCKDEPCPSCGGSIDTASAISSQLPVATYSIDKGVTEETDTDPSTLEEVLEEQEEERRHPENKDADTLNLSPKAAATSLEAALSGTQGLGDQDDGDSGDTPNSADKAEATASGMSPRQAEDMNSEELDQLRELQERDREVRSHEQAHISAGGSLVNGSASYTYQTGPDGKQYAVGGEVSIDTSEVPNDPDATMDRARTIRRAAMAPASPSAQDQEVASQASQMEAEARMEKIAEQREEQGSNSGTGANNIAGAGIVAPPPEAAVSAIPPGARLDVETAITSLMPSSDTTPLSLAATPHRIVHETYAQQQDEGNYRNTPPSFTRSA